VSNLEGGKQMKRLAQVLLLLLSLSFLAVPVDAARGGCGAWRWSVKTLTDPAAGRVNFTPITSTVEKLRALPAPVHLALSTARLPGERRTYRVRASLVEVKEEADSDFHVVLQGSSGVTMIAEMPDPACAAASSRVAALQKVRRAFVQRFGQPDTQRFRPIPGRPMAEVTGVLFFDEIHGQAGVARNGVELHPVLDILFLPPLPR
jgi:hypothetical protein